MKCASALSTIPTTEAAFREVTDRAAGDLPEGGDLAVVFATAHHAAALGQFARDLRGRGLARHVLGTTAESVIAEDREIEGEPAVGLWLLRAPGIELEPFRIEYQPGDDRLGIPEGTTGTLLLLGDPFSFPADPWLKLLAKSSPGLAVIGGLASGADVPERNRLVLDDLEAKDGAVAIRVAGPVAVRAVVSQGCRPIGRPMVVTKAEKNLIRELGRRPALEMLREMFEGLPGAEQTRAREGLHMGRVINEYQESFGRGDFLVRNIIGADESGTIALNDLVRVGQTVQFQVRDADSADEDLKALLASAAPCGPAGALIFSCNGRGSRLFPGPNHDVGVLHGQFGPIPAAGFFAMGEIGPVGGQNFVHGFTASIALFGEPNG